jgi:hypothetical protein
MDSGIAAALLLTALGLLVVPAMSQAETKGKKVTLMTRNVYIGTDATRPLAANNLEELLQITTGMFREVQDTDFRTRAEALAREIDKANPDLVGLQEVALIRTDTPADGPPSLGGTPALEMLDDYLKILTRKLRKRGARYEVVRVQEGADAEVPTTLGFDVRATDRDVILAKRTRRVRTRNESSDRFDGGSRALCSEARCSSASNAAGRRPTRASAGQGSTSSTPISSQPMPWSVGTRHASWWPPVAQQRRRSRSFYSAI